MQRLKQGRLACAGWLVVGLCGQFAAAQTVMHPAASALAAQADQMARPSLADPVDPPAPDPALRASASRESRAGLTDHGGWQLLARSVEQRVIEYRQFGRGEQQILVVGPLDGDEPAGVELLERFVDHLERFPRRLQGATVTVVRDPNPDGRLRGSRANARGVRLDMNFPTRQWRKVPIADRWMSGRTPESEPETRALLDLLDDLRPERVLLVEATRREAQLRFSKSAEPIARRLAEESQMTATSWEAAEAPAGLVTFAGIDRGLAALVLRVPAAAGAEYNWDRYKGALFAAIEGDVAQSALAPSHRLAAFTRAGGAADPSIESKSHSRPSQPRGVVLAAKELEFGGVLAPVVIPSRRPPQSLPRVSAGPQSQASSKKSPGVRPHRWMVPYRGPSQGGLPRPTVPGVFGVPGTPAPYGAINRFPASVAPSTSGSAPPKPEVERLPPIDLNQPPVKPLPKPIPLYPETGY